MSRKIKLFILLCLNFLFPINIQAMGDYVKDSNSNLKGSFQLYYFISFSMPYSLIETYINQSILYKGTIVLRGLPKAINNLSDFMTKISSMYSQKSTNFSLIIDPNLYNKYQIKVVPTLLIEWDGGQYCQLSGPISTEWFIKNCTKVGT